MKNKLRTILISQIHYLCMVSVNDMLSEVIINTSRARLLVYLQIEKKLGLFVKLSIKHLNFSRF